MAESSTTDGRQVAAALRAAGHMVATCREPSDIGFECAALRDGGECPVERLPIDLYLLLRAEGECDVQQERGALCAAARRIPLVVAGAVADNPYRPWTAAEYSGTDVAAVVEDVARQSLPHHSQVALEAVASAVGASTASCSADVRRVAGGLSVVLAASPTPPARLRAAAVAKVHQSLRALDPWARYVDVSFTS